MEELYKLKQETSLITDSNNIEAREAEMLALEIAAASAVETEVSEAMTDETGSAE